MPMTRLRCTVLCCALLCQLASVAQPRPRPPGPSCAGQPVLCQVSTRLFKFPAREMGLGRDPVLAETTVGVSCTRTDTRTGISAPNIQVNYELMALPAEPDRFMRDDLLQYLRYHVYVDRGRSRFWGDGTQGTEVIAEEFTLRRETSSFSREYTIYGLVDGSQLVAPSAFIGAVVTRLNYIASCR